MARLRHLLVVAALAGVFAGGAQASRGHYTFAGGTAAERAQVRAGLDASSFNWDLVPGPVTIHVVRGLPGSYSTPGQIWLDAGLLDTGSYSWGVVQMEYAQQVQFSTILDAGLRAQLTSRLGASQWCYDNPRLPKSANGCERFAAMLAWAYWPSTANCMRPTSPTDWSAAMAPAEFRTLVTGLFAGKPVVSR